MSGYELMIVDDVFRGRFRKSFSNPEPITPGKVEAYTIDLHGADHVFSKKGHKIMVQVQSTWFPITIEPQSAKVMCPIFFDAKAVDVPGSYAKKDISFSKFCEL